ncbi:hypothetical protein VBY91_005544 [Escherichia coli]|nr:hypothetical protein [Escherichia coli]EGB0769725.1 hypothetical protein [Escherichia coli]EGB3284431.1 hypothetical protein [Escherichia coli]EGB3285244.1 hypothetical protein [Escherichia coli]EII7011012.1 hypothetical protein [Escherichia coli]
MGSCAAPSAKGDDKFITTDYLQQCHLWIFKRYMERKELTKPLSRLVYTNLKTARTDSVSLQSVAKRFKEFFEKLSEPTAEMIEKANELRAVEETRRLAHRVQSVSQS